MYKEIRKIYPKLAEVSSLDNIISNNNAECSKKSEQISALESDIANQKSSIDACEKLLDELEKEYPDE